MKNAFLQILLSEISVLMEQESFVVIAIDGRCGSGKTYLAGQIQNLFPCNVCHMDDFYLPFEKRQENWMEIPGGNMDLERFRTEVLLPVKAGHSVIYQPYNCRLNSMEEGIQLPACKLTVIEGSYSLHPVLSAEYHMTVFLTCSKEEQVKRLKQREGSRFAAFEKQWIPLEEAYFRQFEIEKNSQFVIDTSVLPHVKF